MKTNIFNVKEKKDKKIVIEEEKLFKIPFLFPLILFFTKNKKLAFLTLFILSGSLVMVSVGIAFSLFVDTNNYEISYVTGGEEIGAVTDPEIDDEDIKEELLGDVARQDGVVLLEESFLTDDGDVIYYYTDKTAVMVTSKGKIYRITTDTNGNYGVDRNGKLDSGAKKILVTSTTQSLSDGTVITSYSDGTAMVQYNNQVIFVRDSNNIELINEQTFNKVKPSGVALTKSTISIRGGTVYKFTDGTTLINSGEEMFLVNKNTSVEVTNGRVTYDSNNTFKVISEKTYADGNTIRHYSNGAATINSKDGKVIYVRNSGDLVLKRKALYEIVPNKGKANSRGVIECTNGVKVIYYNNGAAVVIYPNNNKRLYVSDADSIIYNNGKNISNNFEASNLISVMLTEDGRKAYSFENGKTQVINKDNTSYIVDTESLNLKDIVEDDNGDGKDDGQEDNKDEDDNTGEDDEGTTDIPINPGEGIYITEAEHEYDDPLDVQSTVFTIKNDSTNSKVLRIVIEEIGDYFKYNTSRLEPQYVKFQSTVGDDYVPASHLTDNTWVDSFGTTNYIIYDGVLKPKTTVTVAISLYVDYSLLDNSHQNKGFLGTIKVYADA